MAPTVLSPPKEGTAAYRVLELLRDGKSRSAVQMEECLNLPQSAICNILKTWERRGYFKKLEKRQWTICSVPVSQHRPLPALGSTAYGIMEILSDGTVKKTKDIRNALGDISWSTVVNAMAIWEAKGLFEQVGHGAWRLKQDVKEEELEEIITPKNYFDDGEELSVKIQDKPYQGNAFRVLAHVQRNQPCKPALMAHDLHLELSEVLSILGNYACFRSEADGWVITNGEVVRS